MVTQGDSGLAQGDSFRVGGGIFVEDVAIPSPAYDAAFMHHDRSDRHFASFERTVSGAQGFLHPEFVGRAVLVCLHRGRCVARITRLKYSGWLTCPAEIERSESRVSKSG